MPEPKEITINIDGNVNSNTQAYAALLSAKKMRLNAKENLGDISIDLNIAAKLEQAAHQHLTLQESPEQGIGNELISPNTANAPISVKRLKKR